MSEETQTPTKPTKTQETQNTQTHSRYETIRVPILRPSEYPIWKVKMAMFLEVTDPEYLDKINEGPYKPTKLSVAVADQPAKMIPKEKSEYIAEDISSIAKDARVRHLLHSAIDNVMSNRVIGCKTAKEIWDALETRCQGTDAIKKNRRTILTQEYEHFDSKADESLTDLYDRFVKLLNDLSLVDKEYDLEDSNLKFFLTLPENWDLKSTTIRDNYDLTETTLDEIYGMLKTYELEMDQRSKRHGRKSVTVALKVEEESSKVAVSKKDKGKEIDDFLAMNQSAAKDEHHLLEGEWNMIWSSNEWLILRLEGVLLYHRGLYYFSTRIDKGLLSWITNALILTDHIIHGRLAYKGAPVPTDLLSDHKRKLDFSSTLCLHKQALQSMDGLLQSHVVLMQQQGAVRLLKYWSIGVEVVFFYWRVDEFCDAAKGILVAVGPYGPGMSLGSLF
ncbi:hypothetical protein AgCh_018595 [Apium graveolens]